MRTNASSLQPGELMRPRYILERVSDWCATQGRSAAGGESKVPRGDEMTLRDVWGFVFALAITSCADCSMLSSQPGAQPPLPSAGAPLNSGAHGRISHVIVMIQENRSFENFFAGYPGANAPTYGCGIGDRGDHQLTDDGCPSGDHRVDLHEVKFEKEPNLSHEFESALIDWHNGKMDGFSHSGLGSHAGTAAYAYIKRSQVQPYWDMAGQYVLADKMFPTEFGPSWTAHLTLVAGTDNLSDNLALADFADGRSNCNAPGGAKTTTVDENRVIRRASGPYPCLDQFNTIAQVLDGAGIQWKYYVAHKLKAFIWSPFSGIKYVYRGPDWDKNIIVPQTQVLDDIAGGTLAPVSWVTPSKEDSDHPGAHSDTGPSWVTAVVDALGESKYWKSSVVIILWDDWGGFFDNAAPPQLDFRGLGIRVPCLIISPYAKQGAVIHTTYEFGSVLRFIRDVFGLPPIGPTSSGYTDSRANSLSNSFNFSQKPRSFTPFRSKYPLQHFLHERPSNGARRLGVAVTALPLRYATATG